MRSEVLYFVRCVPGARSRRGAGFLCLEAPVCLHHWQKGPEYVAAVQIRRQQGEHAQGYFVFIRLSHGESATGSFLEKGAEAMRYVLTLATAILVLFVSPGYAQWVQTNRPYGGFVHALAVSGTNLFAGSLGGVFLSTDNGTGWTAVNTGLTDLDVWSLAVSGTNLFAGTGRGGVFLSTNNGTSWSAVNTGLSGTYVWSLAVTGTNLFAGTYSGGVFLSTSNGTSWTAVNTGLRNTAVYALTVSGTDLFAGTDGGGVFLLSNNGTSWTAFGLPNTRVRSFAVSGTNLFAGTYSGGVFLSTSNGTSWTAVNTGVTNLDVRSLGVSGTNLFAGTYGGGVFLSTNNGSSWVAVNTGLPNTRVRSFAVSGTDLFAGTDGSGVWRRPLSEFVTAVTPVDHPLPEDYILGNSYPNPFNPSTTIEFALSKSAFVTLRVYDLLGRKVGELVNEKLAPGNYTTHWDARGLASGVYFYRLQAGEPSAGSGQSFVETKKLILLR